jgi:hypothetical protein
VARQQMIGRRRGRAGEGPPRGNPY